jgi:hypothetical protein
MDGKYLLVEAFGGATIKVVSGGIGNLVVIQLNVDCDGRITFDANADLTHDDESTLGWEHGHVDERYVAELAKFNEAYAAREQAEWDEGVRREKRQREAKKRRERRAQRRVEIAALKVIEREAA